MKPALKDVVINAISSSLYRSDALKQLLLPTRDIDFECGYPIALSIENYHTYFKREGIATRVVNCLPEESWVLDPDVYETEDAEETQFEKDWTALQERLNVYHYLKRIDILSGIGRFGILILGIDDGADLNIPIQGIPEDDTIDKVSGTSKLLYLRPLGEKFVEVKTRETNTSSPRFGRPLFYSVTFQDENLQTDSSVTKEVHWTRVIHVADDRQESEIYGTPRMEKVFNRLYDLRKVLSGSGEMFWKGAFPGISFETNPDQTDAEIDSEAMREEFQKYSDGLQRYLALTGVTAKPLSPQVADPTGHVENQIKAIALSLGIPLRVFMGTEEARLASGQDALAWAGRMKTRQDKYITPMLLRPFVNRLIQLGAVAQPKEVIVDWPDLTKPDDQQKAMTAVTRTDALAKYVGGGVDQLIPPRDYFIQILHMTPEETDSILESAAEWGEEKKEQQEAEMPEQGALLDAEGQGEVQESEMLQPDSSLDLEKQ